MFSVQMHVVLLTLDIPKIKLFSQATRINLVVRISCRSLLILGRHKTEIGLQIKSLI